MDREMIRIFCDDVHVLQYNSLKVKSLKRIIHRMER